ncbi:uncharacterized protein VNE69_09029 [Vairimorpha necatrix]|uniref:Membrane protein n=1 Tax=Vairimorpha necatrix TaxID=6039 RepID=A0AAX4JEM3_9MICR
MLLLQRLPLIIFVFTSLVSNTYMILYNNTTQNKNFYKEMIYTFLSVNLVTSCILCIFTIIIFKFELLLGYINLIYLASAALSISLSRGIFEIFGIILSILHVLYYTYKIDKRMTKREQEKMIAHEIIWQNPKATNTYGVKVNIMFFINEFIDYIKSLKIENYTNDLERSFLHLVSRYKHIIFILLVTNLLVHLQTLIFVNFSPSTLIEYIFISASYCGLINFYIQISIYFLKKQILGDNTLRIEFSVKSFIVSLLSYVYVIKNTSYCSYIDLENILVVIGYFYMICINRFNTLIIRDSFIKHSAILYSNTILFSLIMICISLSLLETRKI